MKETVLGKKIIMIASELGARLFRVNTGQGWVGDSIRFSEDAKIIVHAGDVLIRKARPLHAGLCDGGSDYIGWTKDGKFLAIETKTIDGTTKKERLEKQLNFIEQVNNAGGIGGICKTEEEAFELLT